MRLFKVLHLFQKLLTRSQQGKHCLLALAKTLAWCAPAVCAPRRGLLGCLLLFACLPACLVDCLCPSQRASCVLLAWWCAGRRSSNGRELQHVAPDK